MDNETVVEDSEKPEDEKTRERRRVMISNWVGGKAIHMNIGGNQTCCPDYACCQPQLLAPKPFRHLYMCAFMEKDEDLKQELLCTFSQYWCERSGFSNPTESKYYSDWMHETKHFSLFAKLKIHWHMWRRHIKY